MAERDEESTMPGTPSTLAMLHEAKRVLAQAVKLLEEVEEAIRFRVEPLTRRVDDHELRLSRIEEHLRRAPTLPPGPQGIEGV